MLTLLARSGDGIIWFTLVAGAYALANRSLRPAILNIGIGLIATAALVALLKFSIRRPRPQGTASAKWSSMPKHDIYSFPSGHAARAACLAFAAGTLHPLAGCLAWAWAVALCWSRVAIQAHFAIDVMAGLLVGGVTGWIVWMLC